MLKSNDGRFYYHVCSNGTTTFNLFADELDFRAGMNRIASVAMMFDICIIAFCLMDTHVHFIIVAKDGFAASNFIAEYIRITAIQYYNRHKVSVAGIDTEAILIKDLEQLKLEIAYVLRNPSAANMNYLPNTYPWSSGAVYFTKSEQGESIDAIPIRKQKYTLGTHRRLPSNFHVTDGLIDMRDYVAVKVVEQVFGSAKVFLGYLGRKVEPDLDIRHGGYNNVKVSPQELRQVIREEMVAKFNVKQISRLTVPQRMSLAKQVHRRLLSSPKQIARAIRLPYEDIKDLL